MERWKKIIRRVQPAEPIENGSKPSACLRPRKSETQRNQQKEKPRDENRRGYAPREDSELAFCPEEKWRGDKEEIDREVGKNHERNKWNSAFPSEVEDADITASRGDPDAAAVNEQEEDRQSGRGDERLTARN